MRGRRIISQNLKEVTVIFRKLILIYNNKIYVQNYTIYRKLSLWVTLWNFGEGDWTWVKTKKTTISDNIIPWIFWIYTWIWIVKMLCTACSESHNGGLLGQSRLCKLLQGALIPIWLILLRFNVYVARIFLSHEKWYQN